MNLYRIAGKVSNCPALGYVPRKGWAGVGWCNWHHFQSHMVVGSPVKELPADMRRKGEGMLGTRDHRRQPQASEVVLGRGEGQ